MTVPREINEDAASAQGWDELTQLTGGIPPEQIDALRGIRELDQVYPLLHSLAGRTLRDFFVRAAALESLVAAEKAVSAPIDLEQTLYWLDSAARERSEERRVGKEARVL